MINNIDFKVLRNNFQNNFKCYREKIDIKWKKNLSTNKWIPTAMKFQISKIMTTLKTEKWLRFMVKYAKKYYNCEMKFMTNKTIATIHLKSCPLHVVINN